MWQSWMLRYFSFFGDASFQYPHTLTDSRVLTRGHRKVCALTHANSDKDRTSYLTRRVCFSGLRRTRGPGLRRRNSSGDLLYPREGAFRMSVCWHISNQPGRSGFRTGLNQLPLKPAVRIAISVVTMNKEMPVLRSSHTSSPGKLLQHLRTEFVRLWQNAAEPARKSCHLSVRSSVRLQRLNRSCPR